MITPVNAPLVPPRVYIDLPITDDEMEFIPRSYPSLSVAMTGRQQHAGPEFRLEGELPDIMDYLIQDSSMTVHEIFQTTKYIRLASQ
jgi:hypothetical protein